VEEQLARANKKSRGYEGHLGFWLRYVSNSVSQAFARKILAEGATVPEWVLMRTIYEHQMTPSDVAGRIGVTRGAVSKIADKLVQRGLVSRTASNVDRRFQALQLTRAGEELVPRITAIADRNDKEFFGHMTDAEKKTLEDMMKEIVRRRGLKAVPLK
jgi:DNA-binding MarR family transcriptional regulator